MKVLLRDLTRSNWKKCVKLRVHKHQKGLVATNLYSIAQSKVMPTFWPKAAYYKEKMVGFVMFGLHPDDSEYWIMRLMVDRKYQGLGYGRAIMQEVLSILRETFDCQRVFLSFDAHNQVAERLYSSLGFIRVRQDPNGEIVACLTLKR